MWNINAVGETLCVFLFPLVFGLCLCYNDIYILAIICILAILSKFRRNSAGIGCSWASFQRKNIAPVNDSFSMHDQATVNGFLCLINCDNRKKHESPQISDLLANEGQYFA